MRFVPKIFRGADNPVVETGVDTTEPEVRHDALVTVEEGDNAPVKNYAGVVEVAQTAAIVFATNLISRAFAAATIEPRYMEPWELAGMARDVMLHGEWVAQLMLDGSGFYFARSADHDIQGGTRPRQWRYRLTIPSPSAVGTGVLLPYDSVCHVRMYTPRTEPWRGRSPFNEMGVTARLLGLIEDGLCREEDMVRLYVLSHGPGVADEAELAEDFSEGGLQLLEQSVQSFGQTRTSNGNQVRGTRVGPAPDQAEITMRAQVTQDILSAAGIPAGLYAPREGSVNREAYRQFHAATLEPIGEAFRAEIEKKTERPFSINFHKLAAADIAARGRGLSNLIAANIHPEDAMAVVGLSGLRYVEPEPEPPPEQEPTPAEIIRRMMPYVISNAGS